MTCSYYHFLSPAIIRVEGPDALRYLNARLSQQIQSGPLSFMQDTAALQSTGRSESFFHVLSRAEDWLLYQCKNPEKTATDVLKQFVVADRVSFESCEELYTLYHICGYEGDAISIPEHQYEVQTFSQSYSIRYDRLGLPGVDLLIHSEDQDVIKKELSNAHALDSNAFEVRRMKTGIPMFPDEINASSFFLEAGCKDAYSTKKGCYVGQEAIEMSLARGKLPAHLMRFSIAATKPFEAGTTLFSTEDTKIGTVVSSAYDSETEKVYGFARIKGALADTQQSCTIDGTAGALSKV